MQSGGVLSSTPHLSALWSVGRVNIFGLPSTHDLHHWGAGSAVENGRSRTLHLPSVSKLPKRCPFLRAFSMARINAAHCYVTESKRLPNFPNWTSTTTRVQTDR